LKGCGKSRGKGFGGRSLLQQGKLDSSPAEKRSISQWPLALGFPNPSAKAQDRKATFFRSAEALLPPHKCGGSHQEICPPSYALTSSADSSNAAYVLWRASACDKISPPLRSLIAGPLRNEIPQRLKPWTRRQFTARLNSLLKNSQKQIPRGLKPARDDKYKRLLPAYLKVRPFKCRRGRVFQQPVKPYHFKAAVQ
jgi:hypothetical protein